MSIPSASASAASASAASAASAAASAPAAAPAAAPASAPFSDRHPLFSSSSTPASFPAASAAFLGATLVSSSTTSQGSYTPSSSPSASSQSSDASHWALSSPDRTGHPPASSPPQALPSMLATPISPAFPHPPPDPTRQPAAERSWASAHRASHREPVLPSPPSLHTPSPLPTSLPQPHSSTPLFSVQAPSEERRNSVYLPIDGTSPAGHDSTWPFQTTHLEASPVWSDDSGMLKSPSQINPVFGLPPRAGTPAAEPYRDPQVYPYAVVAPYESCKTSPPTQYDDGFGSGNGHGHGHGGAGRGHDGKGSERREGSPSRHANPAGKAGAARPFYRSPSVSYSPASTQVNLGHPGSAAPAGRWPLPLLRSGPSHANLSLYHPPPRSPLRASLDSSSAWLVYYFAFNLGLTIYNKRVLQGFPFPWTLTGVHTLCGAIGSQVALSYRFFTPSRLTRRENLTLVAFSVLYTVNIAVSNLSLHLVTVPFHQVVRATTPLFTIALSIVYFGKSYTSATYLALLIVVAGVGLSTFGDYGWTTWGLFLTLLGTLLAALKTVVTNAIQVGRLKLHPLDLLLRMSPLAFVQCVLYSYWSGEMARVREYGATQMTGGKGWALAVNGVIAFGLNVVSFTANKKTSALTMTVAANVKQVLTIVLAVFIFDLVITPTNLCGITLTLVGGAYYAKVELDKKTAGARAKAGAGAGAGVAAGPGEPGGGPHKAGASPLLDIVAGAEKRVKE